MINQKNNYYRLSIMSFKRKLKLPPFRVTTVSTDGAVRSKPIKRGRTGEYVGPLATDACADVRSKPVKAEEQSIMEASVLDSLNMDHSDAEDSSGMDFPTLHEIKQRSNVAAWSGIRHSILDICIEGHAMPVDQQCTYCTLTDAVYRCTRCGPYVFFCEDCLLLHSKNCVYHIPEIWKVYQISVT